MRKTLDPEKVAYWCFRLNGFLQIENFVVHPAEKGGARTDADLLGVRFPHRAERLYDNPADIMADDRDRLALSKDVVDVIIAEVKTNRPCTLNGPWTQADRQNIHRVLAAIGCVPAECVKEAAMNLYQKGIHKSDGLRIRLVAIGRERESDLNTSLPGVVQVVWSELLGFIWDRLHAYRRQKSDVQQWDETGRTMRCLVEKTADRVRFIENAEYLMRAYPGDGQA